MVYSMLNAAADVSEQLIIQELVRKKRAKKIKIKWTTTWIRRKEYIIGGSNTILRELENSDVFFVTLCELYHVRWTFENGEHIVTYNVYSTLLTYTCGSGNGLTI